MTSKSDSKPPKRAAMRKLSQQFLERARQARPRALAPSQAFQPARHPPGVGPAGKGSSALAMDESFSPVLSWAANAMLSALQEGVTFLGYPYLAELAQRAEYRLIVETIATEMTRKWIKLQSSNTDDDKSDKLKQIEAELKRLNAQGAFRKIAEQDGFFGRAHLYIDLGTEGDELKSSIGDASPGSNVSKFKVIKGTEEKPTIKSLRCVEAVWCYPMQYNSTDPLREDWFNPIEWYVMSRPVHASRLLRFVGREVPDILKPAYSFGGLALTQMVKPYVDNWLKTRQAVQDLILSFSTMILSTNMGAAFGGGSGSDVFDRVDAFNAMRSNRGAMVVDKDTEEVSNVTTPLSGLEQLQAQSQEHMASVAQIPIVKLLGIQPAGLNASSEGEIRVFYDRIHAYQESFFTKNLTRVINFVQLALFGEVDPDIGFIYEPLWSLDDEKLAAVRKQEADTDVAYIGAGILDPVESRRRIANDPDTPYQGLDAEDVPEPPEVPGQEAFGEGEEPMKEAAE